MTALDELIKDYKEQYLPFGKISVLSLKDLRSNPLYLQLFSEAVPAGVTIEREQTLHFLSKVTPKIFLEIEGDKDQSNIGLVKNLSKKIIKDLRNSAIVLKK